LSKIKQKSANLPKKFELQTKPVQLQGTNVSKEIALNDQLPFQRVTIKAKVLKIGDTSKLDDGRQVQQVVLADNTTTVELSLAGICQHRH
jgi:hypothetical protein